MSIESAAYVPPDKSSSIPKHIRIVGIALFVLALVCGGAMLYTSMRYKDTLAELKSTRQEVASVRTAIDDVSSLSGKSRYATVPQNPQEMPNFVNEIRTYAELEHVQIVRWMNSHSQVNPSSADRQKLGLPEHVLPLTTFVQIEGRYSDVRAFMYDLLKSARLISLNEMKWSRGAKGPITDVNFNMTRYLQI